MASHYNGFIAPWRFRPFSCRFSYFFHALCDTRDAWTRLIIQSAINILTSFSFRFSLHFFFTQFNFRLSEKRRRPYCANAFYYSFKNTSIAYFALKYFFISIFKIRTEMFIRKIFIIYSLIARFNVNLLFVNNFSWKLDWSTLHDIQ